MVSSKQEYLQFYEQKKDTYQRKNCAQDSKKSRKEKCSINKKEETIEEEEREKQIIVQGEGK